MNEGVNDQLDITDYMNRMLAVIASHGWAVQGVMPTTEDPDPVPFSYTVGLTGFGHPEIIVCGVDPREAGITLLNNLGERVRAGQAFSHGEVPRDLLMGDYDPILIQVDDLTRLSIARRVYGEYVSALQLVLPDSMNRLPWHQGYEMTWQPILGMGT